MRRKSLYALVNVNIYAYVSDSRFRRDVSEFTAVN